MTNAQPIVRRVMKVGESLYINAGIEVQNALGLKRNDFVTLTLEKDHVVVRKVDFSGLAKMVSTQQDRSKRTRRS
jgi:hypothetical protein